MMAAHGTASGADADQYRHFPRDRRRRNPIPDLRRRTCAICTHRRPRHRWPTAHAAGVPIYAGTDAGGSIRHGRIADEIEALAGAGLSRHGALGAARGVPGNGSRAQGIEEGAPADLVVYPHRSARQS